MENAGGNLLLELIHLGFKNETMYYLKIGKLWVSSVNDDVFHLSKNMIDGWATEEEAVDAAKKAAEMAEEDVLVLKMEIIRAIEA